MHLVVTVLSFLKLCGVFAGVFERSCLEDCAQFGLDISGNYEKYSSVPNGQIWLDTDGNAIQAQGGGFLLVGSTYYWVGQDRTPYLAGLPGSEALVNLYSSKDLMNWKKVGVILSVYTPDTSGNQLLTYCKIERPKLIYNAKTKRYVLWAHWEEHATYAPSHVITATATQVEGPYTVTAKGHRRPGAGNKGSNAMGDRIGSLIIDYNTAAKDANDTTHPFVPISHAGYPPTILQYSKPSTSNPQAIKYVSQSDYGTFQVDNPWTYELTGVHFNLTINAVSVNMTAFDASYYYKYKDKYKVSSEKYIVRYPTAVRSHVAQVHFTIGNPCNERIKLVAPEIRPGLDESASKIVVYMKIGDAAFITVSTTGAQIHYTIDGTDPRTGTSMLYLRGTRIVLQGEVGKKMVVKAFASVNGKNSSVTTQTYEVASNPSTVPIFTPIFNYPSGTYNATSDAFGWKSARIYSPSFGTNCYYTMDGLVPEPPVFGDNVGYGSRDMTVWQDPHSGHAYLISAQDNIFGRLWKLNEDFTEVVPELEYDVWTDLSREAPAVVRNGGKNGKFVYILTSTQSGYFPNQGQYMRTGDLAAGFALPRDEVTGYRDGFSLWSGLQPFADASTFYSQSTYIVNIGTDSKPVYIFMADRYNTVPSMGYRSTFVWMPLTIDDDAPSEAGVRGSGYIQVKFQPKLQINITNQTITKPNWRLLSLNKHVLASPAVQLTPDQVKAGTYNFSAQAANDGINYDVDVYDDIKHYYKPSTVPFYWRVDLGAVNKLQWVGLSFMSVGGSDAVNRYTILGSVDSKKWVELIANTESVKPGYMNHNLEGSYRYVQLNVFSVWDVDHNKDADWEIGVYQVSVYGQAFGVPMRMDDV